MEQKTSDIRKYYFSLCLCFVLLVLGCVSGSSIGSPMLRDTSVSNTEPITLAGVPRDIRSDEFLRVTPYRLGLAKNSSENFGPTLSTEPSSVVITANNGIISNLVNFDSSLGLLFGSVNPLYTISFLWWISFFGVLIAFPVWAKILGIPHSLSVPISYLLVLSPSVAWWSFGPLSVLFYGLITAISLHKSLADNKSKKELWLWSFLTALSLTKLVFSYFPWALPIGLAFVLPVIFQDFKKHSQHRFEFLKRLVIATVTWLAVFSLYIFEQKYAIEALSGTSYPGSRRSIGQIVGMGQLFGAPFLGILQENPELISTNQSEVSTAFLILVLPVFLSLYRHRGIKTHFNTVYFKSQFVVFLILLSWVTVEWPSIARSFYPINLVPPQRLSAVIGFQATALFLSSIYVEHKSKVKWKISEVLVFAGLMFLFLANAGGILRGGQLPSIPLSTVWLVGILFTFATILPLVKNKKMISFIPIIVLCASVTYKVNPIQIGSADLLSGKLASAINAVALQDDLDANRWASDSITVDSYFMANAIPSESGQQWVGPNSEQWIFLDPTRKYVDNWNRGQAFITFRWNESLTSPIITNPSPEQILIEISPCDAALSSLKITRIISGQNLKSGCLAYASSTSMGGIEWRIYRIKSS